MHTRYVRRGDEFTWAGYTILEPASMPHHELLAVQPAGAAESGKVPPECPPKGKYGAAAPERLSFPGQRSTIEGDRGSVQAGRSKLNSNGALNLTRKLKGFG